MVDNEVLRARLITVVVDAMMQEQTYRVDKKAEQVVDALLGSGMVVPFDTANRAVVDMGHKRDECLEALRAVSDICFNDHEYRDPIVEITGITQPILNRYYDQEQEATDNGN